MLNDADLLYAELGDGGQQKGRIERKTGEKKGSEVDRDPRTEGCVKSSELKMMGEEVE